MPIAVIGIVVFPALTLLFFVVPQDVARQPTPATAAVAQIAVFSIMTMCLFVFGVGIAEDRQLPWYSYLRTLPAGPGPRILGAMLNGVAFAVLSLVPIAVLAWLLTEATLPVSRWAATVPALIAVGIPFLGLGMAVGYAMPAKAAIAVAQSLLLPLAFAGGLFIPPQALPAWLDTLSLALPSRAGRDLVVAVTAGADLPTSAVPVLLAWSLALGTLATLAYRRDEGRRFR